MPVENIMYFALGLLLSGLLALLVMPAVWKRAVRLTTKRIEAATPITMAEFRADKDQLRAEFALSTRRLEMNVEALRRRLADQLRDINVKKSELGGMKDTHLSTVRELEEHESELRARVLELEKEGADLAQKLRARDREYAEKVSELEATQEAARESAPRPVDFDGRALTGDYNQDVEDLVEALEIERKRAAFLETQNRTLIAQLEASDRRTADAASAAAELRQSLAVKDEPAAGTRAGLVVAEARIANAESRVNALLEQTGRAAEPSEPKQPRLLAEKLTLEEEMERLKGKVLSIELTVMVDWDSDRIDPSRLREQLNDIATDVSHLVYAAEANSAPEAEESLFDRVQRFADDGLKVEAFPLRTALQQKQNRDSGPMADRLAAIREMQEQK